jgi:hypothetical protein
MRVPGCFASVAPAGLAAPAAGDPQRRMPLGWHFCIAFQSLLKAGDPTRGAAGGAEGGGVEDGAFGYQLRRPLPTESSGHGMVVKRGAIAAKTPADCGRVGPSERAHSCPRRGLRASSDDLRRTPKKTGGQEVRVQIPAARLPGNMRKTHTGARKHSDVTPLNYAGLAGRKAASRWRVRGPSAPRRS